MQKKRSPLLYRGILSVGFLPLWQFALVVPLVFSAYRLSDAEVQRSEHLLAEARRCAYRICAKKA